MSDVTFVFTLACLALESAVGVAAILVGALFNRPMVLFLGVLLIFGAAWEFHGFVQGAVCDPRSSREGQPRDQ